MFDEPFQLSRRYYVCCGAGFSIFLNQTANARARHCNGPNESGLAAIRWANDQLQHLDNSQLCDSHCHILGVGDNQSGCTINPSLTQWWRPTEFIRRKGILSASCARSAGDVDLTYVQRLLELLDGM